MGGRGGSSGNKNGSAKVSSSGLLPNKIKAKTAKEAAEKFNNQNYSKDGRGYKAVNKGSGRYDIHKTFKGKKVPGSTTRAYLDRNKNGTWRFWN